MGSLSNIKVAIVEDESDIAELIRFNLELDGAKTNSYVSGETFLSSLPNNPPDIILLDLMLPGISGLDICKKLRNDEKTAEIPIIMVTAKGSESDIIRGIEQGADDYITKPFSPKVLVAKVSAVLRRTKVVVADPQDVIQRNGIQIHPGRHEVFVNNQKIDLRNSEFKILQFLAQRPGWVFTRSQIVNAIHGEHYAVTERSVDFQMVGLRKKLGDAGEYIETIRGVGYRFKESD